MKGKRLFVGNSVSGHVGVLSIVSHVLSLIAKTFNQHERLCDETQPVVFCNKGVMPVREICL